MDAHHAGLGGEDVVVGRLDLPQRAQAQRVGREDALVAVAGDQRHRALRERAHRLAQVHVEGVQLVGKRADLVHDRRHDHLHRLGERQPSRRISVSIDPVQVLRVRGPRRDRDAQHLRLLAELRDRVDLAVVAEHGERLHALERRPGVGGVAVVAEAADRLEPLVAQVRVVGAQHLRRAHHLVDARRRRERGNVEAQARARARSSSSKTRSERAESATRPPICQKCGSSSRAVAPSACESTSPRRSARIAEAAGREHLAGVVLEPLEIRRTLDEDVGHAEAPRPGPGRGCGRRRGPPRPRSCAGCRPARRSRRPRRRRCRRGGASSGGSRGRSATGSWLGVASLRPRRRSRTRPGPRPTEAETSGRQGSSGE